jgi:hypothetical protein
LRIALLIVVLGVLTSAETVALECPKYPYSDNDATVIFAGEVVEIERADPYGVARVRFKVLELRRGPYSPFITIQFQDNACDPGAASFKVGDRYLMSGRKLEAASSASDEAKMDLAQRPLYFNHSSSLRRRLPVTPNISLERTREG